MLIASSVISISSSKWQAQVIGAITNMTQIMGVNTTINSIGKSIKGKMWKKLKKKNTLKIIPNFFFSCSDYNNISNECYQVYNCDPSWISADQTMLDDDESG